MAQKKAPATSEPGIVRVPLKAVELAVRLTEAEKAQRAATAAELLDKAEDEEDQLRGHVRAAKVGIKRMHFDARVAIKAHIAGAEVRQVDCERVYDIGTNATWIDHGGNFYDHRAMTADEITRARQPGVFDENEGLKQRAEADAIVAKKRNKRGQEAASGEKDDDDFGEDDDLSEVYQEEKQPRRRKDHTA